MESSPGAKQGLHVLLYLAPDEGARPLVNFARVNLPPLASRITLAAAAERTLDYASSALDLPAWLPVRGHRLTEAGSRGVALACEELAVDLAIAAAPEPGGGFWNQRRVDWGLLERLPVPVLWTRGRGRRIRRILLASGGDEHTLVDAAVVSRLALPLEADVTALHVSRPLEAVESSEEEGSSEAERVLAEAHRILQAQGVNAALAIREGPVVETILQELDQDEYDLLVVGAHSGSGLLDRLLIANVTRGLAGSAPIPVLVARVWPNRD